MIVAEHFGSISGGKDSQAVLCLMVERIERKGLAMFGNHARRFLAEVDRVREWERLVSLASCRTALAGTPASLLPAPTVSGDRNDYGRATIDRAIEWSRTDRGGRNYDLFVHLERRDADEHGLLCDSEYGLCE